MGVCIYFIKYLHTQYSFHQQYRNRVGKNAISTPVRFIHLFAAAARASLILAYSTSLSMSGSTALISSSALKRSTHAFRSGLREAPEFQSMARFGGMYPCH